MTTRRHIKSSSKLPTKSEKIGAFVINDLESLGFSPIRRSSGDKIGL